jgi:signal peptidase I
MEKELNFFENLWENNPGLLLLAFLLLFVGIIGKIKLFAKANQPIAAAFVPVWDMMVTLKIVGRPASHLAFFLIPVYNVYFGFKLLIEIAQTFGKFTFLDYLFVCVFNVFYILNLALAYNEEYLGPVYNVDMKELEARKASLAYE